MEQLLTTAQAAERLGVGKSTMEMWRWQEIGPVYLKMGATVRYRASDLDAWVASRAVVPKKEGKE